MNISIIFYFVIAFISLIEAEEIQKVHSNTLEIKNAQLFICSPTQQLCPRIKEFVIKNEPVFKANESPFIKINFQTRVTESDTKMYDAYGYLAPNGNLYPEDTAIIDNRRTKV
jgi:hypothetical protein